MRRVSGWSIRRFWEEDIKACGRAPWYTELKGPMMFTVSPVADV